jgi:3-hydroxybutyryl-CoA dehydrogenase
MTPAGERILPVPELPSTSGSACVIGSAYVIGGGRMGAGIAHALLMTGARVTVIEPDARPAEERIRKSVARSCEKLQADEGPILARLSLLGAVEETGPGADLIIEAVPEQPRLKAAVLGAAEERAAPGALIATNTSSLSIGELGSALRYPERFLGMHFFNPVPSSALVELVLGPDTAHDTLARAQAIVSALGKTSIVVRDSPGFATSRLGLALGLEAMRMLEEGVAAAEDIDQAMVLGYRHPMGPLRLTDMVGLDVRLAVAEHLSATLGPRFEPPRILRDKVTAGQLGVKTGQGFYEWH